jgi:hypothetical protein
MGTGRQSLAVSPAYCPHPEFRSLFSSTSFRHRAGLAVAALGLLVIVSSLALTAGRDPDVDVGRSLPRNEEAPTDAGSSQAAILTTTAKDARSLPDRGTGCEGDPWSHIDGKCNVGKTRKHLRARAANEKAIISELPLGRTSSPASASSSLALVTPGGTDPIADTPTLAKSDSAGPGDPAPAKAHKSLRSRNRGRDLSRDSNWYGDPWNAHANALPGNRGPSSTYAWSWGWSCCSSHYHCDKTRTLR